MGRHEPQRKKRGTQTPPEKQTTLEIIIRIPFLGKPDQQMRAARSVLRTTRLGVHGEATGFYRDVNAEKGWIQIDDKELHKN